VAALTDPLSSVPSNVMSLAAALCSGVGAVHAAELDRVQYVQDTDDDGSADEPAIVALSDEIPWYEEIVTPPHWFDAPAFGAYGQADALWLARAHNVERTLVVKSPNDNIPALSAQDASLTGKFDLGTLFTLGYQLDKVAAVELTFFGFQDWDSSASVSDPTNNLHLAGTLSPFTNDFQGADRMTITYSSRLFNAEANYKQTIEGLTLLAGFRWFNLTEQFNLNSHSAIFCESSDYHVTAYNYLVGLQSGAGYSVQWGRLNLGILGKIGVFANVASQKTLLRDFGNTQIDRSTLIPTGLRYGQTNELAGLDQHVRNLFDREPKRLVRARRSGVPPRTGALLRARPCLPPRRRRWRAAGPAEGPNR
jgi:hypothetical protein